MKQEIVRIEAECERIGKELQQIYQKDFHALNEMLVIELIREKKGKCATAEDRFTEDYDSYLELGVEKDDGYYPNAYIPIWKCRREMFQTVGYLTSQSYQDIENKLHEIIGEMQEDHVDERDNN